MSTLAPPPQWPAQVVEQYEPVRRLGKGGFASVVLAKRKSDNSLAAMKVVGSEDFNKQDYGYAHREIDILKELSHPNIMKVLDYWESQGSLVVMALSYAQGPTLDHLLRHGGAFSLTFGRVVMAQLVDALASLHSRAVIHRDIKPDNVVVTGASASQDEIWIDPEGTTNEKSLEEWKELCKKWHVTLVDFGFARALSPEDIEMEKAAAATRLSTSQQTISSSRSRHGMDSSRRNLDKSVSHALKRQMSALGNRLYAAPEIVQGVHSRHSVTGSLHPTSRHSSGVDITKTLSNHVADYGMLADAFSLGNTLQYMMTGVPPNQNVNETVRNQNSPVTKAFQWIAEHACASKDAATGRKYQYRAWKDMPKETMRLIRALNDPSVSRRISVRATRRYPLIESVLDDPNVAAEQEEAVHHQIHFLKCAMKKKSKSEAESPPQRETKVAIVAQEEPTDRTETDPHPQEDAGLNI